MEDGLVRMDERYIDKRFEEDAARFEKKYEEYIQEASDTFNDVYKKHDRHWSMHDTVGLGQYLDTWETYANMFEADATTRKAIAS